MGAKSVYLDARLPDRFWDKVRIVSGCWIWQGSKSRLGYGAFKQNGKVRPPHQLTLALVERLVPGLEIDHTCKRRDCCNPEHLEQVTHEENVARAWQGYVRVSHCYKGHPYPPWVPGKRHRCLVCHKEAERKRRGR